MCLIVEVTATQFDARKVRQADDQNLRSRFMGERTNVRPYRREKQKKPTWRNALRRSTTSAYFATSLPGRPGCS